MLATGFAVIFLALLPTSVWLDVLRPGLVDPPANLTRGVWLFRGSLAALGVLVVAAGRLGWWRRSVADGISASRPNRLEVTVLIGLLAAGAALRLYGLNAGLWVDEVTTLVDYVRSPVGTIVTTYGSQNQHLLFSILAHLSVATFGESAASLRLPAALFGIATIWACWRLGRDLSSPREAVLAAAMLTFSYQHIWFSQNARGYSALLFFTVLSTSFLVRGLRGGHRAWLGYAVTVALGMYTHLTMVFAVAGHFAVYLWTLARGPAMTRADRSSSFFGGFAAAGLLTVAAYALVLPQIPGAAASDLSNVAEWRSLGWMLTETARGLNGGPGFLLAALLGLGIVGSGFVSYSRQSAVLPLMFAVPVLLGATSMLAMGHDLWPRVFFCAAVFGILLVVRGLSVAAAAAGAWRGWSSKKAVLFATGVTMLAIIVLARSLPYVHRPKQDYAAARDFVEGLRGPTDAAVAVGVASLAYRAYYAPDWLEAETVGELQSIREHAATTWLVFTLPIEMENTYPDIFAIVKRDFRLVRTFDGSLGDGAIYVWRAESSMAAPGVLTKEGT